MKKTGKWNVGKITELTDAQLIALIKQAAGLSKTALIAEWRARGYDLFTVEIPKVGTVASTALESLGDVAWTAVHTAPNGYSTGYGASEVGSRWPVKKNGELIGTMRYNGRFDAGVAKA